MILFIDFETTGLLKPDALGASVQPHIIEVCGKVYAESELDCVELVDEYHALIKPPIDIPPKITKVTGIDAGMLADAEPFAAHVERLQSLFLGVETLVAHNAEYDKGVLWWELKRLNLEKSFPFAPKTICTVDTSMSIKRYRLKLIDLFEIATGERYDEKAHRADNDVDSLVECYRFLKEKGLIV